MREFRRRFPRNPGVSINQPRCLYLPDGSPHWLDTQPSRSAAGCNSLGVALATPDIKALECQRRDATELVSADSFFLPDGTHVDLVRNPKVPDRLAFLLWKNRQATIADQIEADGKVFLPPPIHPSVARAVQLPTGVQPCGQLHDMLQEISDFVAAYVDLPDVSRFLVSTFVLSTWFRDRLNVAPYLWVTGPFGSGKTTLLNLLHCVCWRAVLVGDITPATLYRLPNMFKLTLLIDEAELRSARASRDMQRLLRTGSSPGIPAVRNGILFQTYGPKVFASRQLPEDTALISRALCISMLPTQRNMPVLDTHVMQEMAEYFQPRLLELRGRNFERVRSPELLGLQRLTPRVRDLLHALAAPLIGNADLERRLVKIFKDRDREARFERSLEPEWLVMEALFELSHKQPVGRLFVGNIAWQAERIAAERGDWQRFGSRRVGNILRISLGLKTAPRIGRGCNIEMTRASRRKIHELAATFGITRRDITHSPTDGGGTPCRLCSKFGLNGGLRFFRVKRRKRPPAYPGQKRRNPKWSRLGLATDCAGNA